MSDLTSTDSCQKCERQDSPHFEGVCLECWGIMFMWFPIAGMDEPRGEVVKRRIKRIKDRLEGVE